MDFSFEMTFIFVCLFVSLLFAVVADFVNKKSNKASEFLDFWSFDLEVTAFIMFCVLLNGGIK